MLCHLIYVSAASSTMTPADLEDILRASRRNNEANGLTGLLLFKDGRFIQLLEGDETDVDATFARVKEDPRHRSVEVIRHEYVMSRSFADWSMGFGNIDAIENNGRLCALPLQDVCFESAYFDDSPSSAHALLLAFRNELWQRL